MTPEQEAKLPTYARNELTRLRNLAIAATGRVAAAKTERDAVRLATNPDSTDTVIDRYADIPIGLPRGECVRFKLAPLDRSQWVDVRVVRNTSGHSYIEVMGGESLVVTPNASNVLYITTRER